MRERCQQADPDGQGSVASYIAKGYAIAGNKEQVQDCLENHSLQQDTKTHRRIIQGYAQGGYQILLNEHLERYRAILNDRQVNIYIAHGYAEGGHDDLVKQHCKTHPNYVSSMVSNIVYCYAINGNTDKVRYYEQNHCASTDDSVEGYIWGGHFDTDMLADYRRRRVSVEWIAKCFAERYICLPKAYTKRVEDISSKILLQEFLAEQQAGPDELTCKYAVILKEKLLSQFVTHLEKLPLDKKRELLTRVTNNDPPHPLGDVFRTGRFWPQTDRILKETKTSLVCKKLLARYAGEQPHKSIVHST